MKKIMLLCFLIISFSVLGLANIHVSAATTGTYDKLKYEINKGQVTITGCTTSNIKITIPYSIEGYPVTTIANDAFNGKGIKSVEFGSNVTTIGDYAFRNCTFSKVTIPKNVTSIGKSAFSFCQVLDEVTIEGTPSLGDNVFYSTTLEILKIPSIDFLINNSNKQLLSELPELYVANTLVDDLSLFDGKSSIPDNIFYEYLGLKKLEIPDTIKTIGSFAFYGCDNVETIVIPDSVTSIGKYAFSFSGTPDNIFYNGSDASWNSISIGDGNSILEKKKNFFNVTIIDENNNLISDKKYSEGDVIDISDIEKTYTRETILYIDKGFSEKYDVSSRIYSNTVLYAKFGDRLDRFYNISNAEIQGFKEVVTWSSNNNQNIKLILNDKELKEDDDFVVWYYNNSLKGTAKLLVIGVGDYFGYIEKTYQIEGDVINAPSDGSIVVSPDDKVNIFVPSDIKEMTYKKNGITVSTSASYFRDDYEYSFSEGTHTITYSYYYWVEEDPVWDPTTGRFVINKTRYNPTVTVTIKSVVNEEVSKVEIEQILEGGRDKFYVKANVYPYYACDSELTWYSSDESVAVVDNYGVITLKKAGKAMVYASTDNGKEISVEIDVVPLKITNANIKSIVFDENMNCEVSLRDKYGDLRAEQDYTISSFVENDILTVEIKGTGLYSGRIVKGYNIDDMSETTPIIKYISGDVDEDGEINSKDIILTRRFAAGGYGVSIHELAADVDESGDINSRDIILMRRYIAGGYGVELN